MRISVLTPTYNRSNTLPNLYNSLIKNYKYQKNIEWLIMDDGSTDNTEELVKKWIKENFINIKYYKQNNQGKMAALNNLLEHITGEITIECDSDDYFTDNCFKEVIEKYDLIKDNKKIYGLAFLRITKAKEPIGKYFNEDGQIKKIFDLYFKDDYEGDTCLIFKSEVRKKYKHELENKERFVTEGRMYHKMDLKYDGLMCFNIPGIVCEYLEDGYTKNIIKIFKNNPYGYYKYYLEMFNFNFEDIPFKKRLHIIKHYILFSCLTNKTRIETIKNTKGKLNKILVSILVIPGYVLTKKRLK